MREREIPWGWRCECGITSDHTAQFCWSCGKPASGGVPVQFVSAPPAPAGLGSARDLGQTTEDDTAPGESGTTLRAPLRLVDAEGRLLMCVSAGAAGPLLQLFAASGEPVANLGVTPDGGALTLSTPGGPAVVILMAAGQGGYAGVLHPPGVAATELRAAPDGGRCVTYHPTGHPKSSS